MPLDIVPALDSLADTPASVELARLATGEPWFTTQIAGLPFYDYARHDPDLDVVVMPRDGDVLYLVRQPDNPHVGNAIQINWRNDRMLGHVLRDIARDVATLLYAGAVASAYVIDSGDGDAWSCRELIVGAAATPLHERHMRHVVSEALKAIPECEDRARRRALKRAERSADRLAVVRTRRLRQAVDVLMIVPFEPDLPAIGKHSGPDELARILGCSRSTLVRIAAGPGIQIGRYFTWLEITPALDGALRAWCRAPRSKIDPWYVQGRRLSREEPPWKLGRYA